MNIINMNCFSIIFLYQDANLVLNFIPFNTLGNSSIQVRYLYYFISFILLILPFVGWSLLYYTGLVSNSGIKIIVCLLYTGTVSMCHHTLSV